MKTKRSLSIQNLRLIAHQIYCPWNYNEPHSHTNLTYTYIDIICTRILVLPSAPLTSP